MTFSDILRLLIEERGITQKKLAGDLHIAVSTLGGYYLLDFRAGKTNSHAEDDILRVFRSLTPSQQEIYLEQGKAILRINSKGDTQ